MRPPVLFRYLDKYCRHSEEAGDCNTEFGMRKAELLLSFRAGGGKDFFFIQSLRQQAKNPPVGSYRVTTTASQTLCHFRALRGNPPDGCRGKRQLTFLSLRGGFHGLRPLNDGNLWFPRPLHRPSTTHNTTTQPKSHKGQAKRPAPCSYGLIQKSNPNIRFISDQAMIQT